MNEKTPYSTTKKARYIASIFYLLVLAFLVGGSYINQQTEKEIDINTLDDEEIIWPELK